MTLPSALAAIIRAFVSTPEQRDAFVRDNHHVLSELAPADKRVLWALMNRGTAA